MGALYVIFQVVSPFESLGAFCTLPRLRGVALSVKSNERRNQGLQF